MNWGGIFEQVDPQSVLCPYGSSARPWMRCCQTRAIEAPPWCTSRTRGQKACTSPIRDGKARRTDQRRQSVAADASIGLSIIPLFLLRSLQPSEASCQGDARAVCNQPPRVSCVLGASTSSVKFNDSLALRLIPVMRGYALRHKRSWDVLLRPCELVKYPNEPRRNPLTSFQKECTFHDDSRH